MLLNNGVGPSQAPLLCRQSDRRHLPWVSVGSTSFAMGVAACELALARVRGLGARACSVAAVVDIVLTIERGLCIERRTTEVQMGGTRMYTGSDLFTVEVTTLIRCVVFLRIVVLQKVLNPQPSIQDMLIWSAPCPRVSTASH